MRDKEKGKAIPIEKLKKSYEEAQIPTELQMRINAALRRAEIECERGTQMKQETITKRRPNLKNIAGIAAAIILFVGAFGIGVSSNQAFAASMEKVPLLGSLAKIFTTKEIHQKNKVSSLSISIPEVDGLTDKKLQETINHRIQEDMETAIAETEKILEEYKEARLETGTSEEDYVPTKLTAGYEAKCNNDQYLSIKVWVAQDFSSAYYQEFIYNYDLLTGKPVKLIDLLGKDYIAVANQQVADEIAVRNKNAESSFYTDDQGFQSIKEDQTFYVNSQGNPVLIFDEYEIAPGYMGRPEFEIKRLAEPLH